MNEQFGIGKKWFWIGIAMGFFNVVAGLVYGIALAIEKDRRQEGLIIIGWTITWALIGFFLIGPYLVKSGMMPKFEMIGD
ncbi:MAG: hypothetical protein AAB496_01115 [Patescibacteria group bacterium]